MLKSKRKRQPKINNIVKDSILKIAAFSVIVALNWAGISAVIETVAYYNDIEQSPVNNYTASTLDFSLNSPPDFSPVIMPNATSSRDISLTNDGILGFQYTVTTTNATGTLCDYLNLAANLEGNNIYNGPLATFNYNAGLNVTNFSINGY